jgi:hypothetical protein
LKLSVTPLLAVPLPNLPRQDTLRILQDLALNNQKVPAIHRHPLRFTLDHFTRFFSGVTLALQELPFEQ